MTAFIGVDWGTSNMRAWCIGEDGAIFGAAESGKGVGMLDGDAVAVFDREVHQPLGPHLPVLMCGMIGSNLGWRAVDYVCCPARESDLATSAVSVRDAPPVRIVPGLRCDGVTPAPDIMRGEETQILGWLAASPAHGSGQHILCLPGTHSKWAIVEDGAIIRFITAMTGELFHVLSRHSVLKADESSFFAEAFHEGLHSANKGSGLSVRLFSARARLVAAGADPTGAASYLSGLLIGSEIGSAIELLDLGLPTAVHLIASPVLRDRYARALELAGFSVFDMDGSKASIAGLRALVLRGALA